MLTIRMQRGGRKGHPHYRIVVQDSRFSPTSGRVVANIGSFDPHTKETTIDVAKASAYIANGAQPSPRVVSILQKQGVELPTWVKTHTPKTGVIRHATKLRRNVPAPEVVVEEVAAEIVEVESDVVAEVTA
jgi:small subunit ribosomal protein S16